MPGKPRPWVARVVAGVVAGAVLTLMALAQMRVHDRVSHAAEVNLDTRTSASAAFLSRYWAAVVGPGGGDVTAALDAYLKTTLPASVGRAYLVDGDGDLLATSGATRGTGAAGTLAAADGALARASASAPCGSYRAADGASFYSSRAVAGTPSRLVLAATQSVLLGKVGVGAEAWLGRVFLAGFAVVLSALAWLFIRAREGRDRSELAARVDLVTSVGNRRACDEQLARLLAENRRHGSGVGVVIVDVDHFKAINDRHGHAAGDGVLRQVAATISGCLRAEDFVGRWGGEEFMVLMGHTDAVGMVSAAERVRQALARAAFTTGGQTVSITISAGAALAGYCDNAADVLGRADSALYRAKAEGRDRVALAPSPTRHLTAV